MQMEIVNRIQTLEVTVQDNKSLLNSVTEALSLRAIKWKRYQQGNHTPKHSKKKTVCYVTNARRNRCLQKVVKSSSGQYSGAERRFSEDFRKIVTPEVADQLFYTLDVAYRLGPRSKKARSSRCSIYSFCHALFKIKSREIPEP